MSAGSAEKTYGDSGSGALRKQSGRGLPRSKAALLEPDTGASEPCLISPVASGGIWLEQIRRLNDQMSHSRKWISALWPGLTGAGEKNSRAPGSGRISGRADLPVGHTEIAFARYANENSSLHKKHLVVP